MDRVVCKLCGHPMPPGEEMFNYHGHSGPCPAPPLSNRASIGGLPPDSALRIARFAMSDARAATGLARHLSGAAGGMAQTCAFDAAEHVIVERGLSEEYGMALMEAIPNTHLSSALGACWLATAPLDVRLRALLAVVEAEEKKHQAPGAADEALAPTPAARQPGESQAEAVGSERLTSRETGPSSEAGL